MIQPLRAELLPETRKFLREWLEWSEAGAPEHRAFMRHNGLCVTARIYDSFTGTKVKDDLRKAFKGLFKYPFGKEEYAERLEAHTQHLDPNRLAWVRANI